jgi:hypothetical protein
MTANATAFIPLAEAAKQIPGRPHVSTCHRWAVKGVNGVKLETKRVGNRRFTTQAAIDEFIEELNKTDAERLAAEGC